MNRKWADIMTHETQILKMREVGKSRAEIAEELGISKKQIENWVTRYNKRKSKGIVIPLRRGRQRTRPLTAEERVLELERELELYKSFLHAAGRM